MELLNGESKGYDLYFKICLLGKSSIGKTILSSRLTSKNYLEFKNKITSGYKPTVGFEFIVKDAKVDNKIIKLQMWDFCGDEIYMSLIQNFYRNMSAFLIFYDCNERSSFEKAKIYFQEAQNIKKEDSIYILIRTKYELKNKENKDFVSDEEALEYANEKHAYFCHISAFEKYETGIYELFKLIIERLIEYYNN